MERVKLFCSWKVFPYFIFLSTDKTNHSNDFRKSFSVRISFFLLFFSTCSSCSVACHRECVNFSLFRFQIYEIDTIIHASSHDLYFGMQTNQGIICKRVCIASGYTVRMVSFQKLRVKYTQIWWSLKNTNAFFVVVFLCSVWMEDEAYKIEGYFQNASFCCYLLEWELRASPKNT